MHPLGSRKDHSFDSDGQIKATRGRAANEEEALIREQFNECLACGRHEQLACADCPARQIK
jgi:hypothetical protein